MLRVLKIALYTPKFSLTVFSWVCFVLPGTHWEEKAVSAPNQFLVSGVSLFHQQCSPRVAVLRVIPSCPSESRTPSIFLISRSLSSPFAQSFYFQSLGIALSHGLATAFQKCERCLFSLAGKNHFGLTKSLHGQHQTGLPVLSFPSPLPG